MNNFFRFIYYGNGVNKTGASFFIEMSLDKSLTLSE